MKMQKKIFSDATKIDENYDNAHYNLAIALHRQGKIDEAIKELNTTLEINPKYSNVYVVFGLMSLREKKFEEALVHYNKAMEINPENIEARYQRAIVYALQQRYDEALEENREVLRRIRNMLMPHTISVRFIIEWIGWTRQMEWYDKITKKIDPLYEDAYYNRAQIYSMQGDHSKAYSDYMSYSMITKWRTGKTLLSFIIRMK
ncbi:tetratricopeptide repeat protein [Candidatus Kuenenia stuttgartiensis]|uniref:tetratricopeptide repeat protein n=1 Tax=Kuenenia stuttgartiensis TaxID=174633 RepID=UPI00146B59FC|nr:tetratricopeptide repeat protein [Candidatus Kuenenia stuttgartiensis]